MKSSPGQRDFAIQRPEKINLSNLGGEPLLTCSDLNKILGRTNVKLLTREIDPRKFLLKLNNTIERYLRARLGPSVARNDLNRLENALTRYRTISTGLLHSATPPPLLPFDWMQEFSNWLEKMDGDLRDKAKTEKIRTELIGSFYPRLLGLFHAGFGIEPDNTVAWGEKGQKGAAFRFIFSLSEVAVKRVNERGIEPRLQLSESKTNGRGLTENAHGPAKKKKTAAEIVFGTLTNDAVCKRIAKALTLEMVSKTWTRTRAGEGHNVFENSEIQKMQDLAWRIHSATMRQQISR